MSHHDDADIGVLLGRAGYLLSRLSPDDRLLVVSRMEIWAEKLNSVERDDANLKMAETNLFQHIIN